MRIAWLVALGVLTLSAAPATQRSESAPTVSEVEWIVGCWAGQRGGSSFREWWTKAGDELMLGVSYTVGRSGKPESFEFLRIAVRQGRLVYIAQPNGRPETVFERVQDAGLREVVFANPTHDYPKRVVYKATPTGLLASIDDGASESTRRIDFAMTRTSCETSQR